MSSKCYSVFCAHSRSPQSWWIPALSSSGMRGVWRTLSLWGIPKENNLGQKVKRLGGRGDYGLSLCWVMWPGKISLITSIKALAVWAVAPFCWNHARCLLMTCLFSSGKTKLGNMNTAIRIHCYCYVHPLQRNTKIRHIAPHCNVVTVKWSTRSGRSSSFISRKILYSVLALFRDGHIKMQTKCRCVLVTELPL